MKCDEIRQLHGSYQDSELDTRTTLTIQRHLATCPACAEIFATASKLDARVMDRLRQGRPTQALWEEVERKVVAAAASSLRAARNASLSPRWWREFFWPCPQAWAGLAAVWVAVLIVNAVSNPEPEVAVRKSAPLAPEVRLALKQQGQLLSELIGPPEPSEAQEPRPSAVSPRSEITWNFLNT